MKIIDRYIVFSILRTALATLAICTLLVVAVEMFSSMNSYVTNAVPLSQILWLSVLGLPEYLMMCASISFLFATTFFLSQLEGNNEMIMFLNAGLGYRRICLPVVMLSLIVTLVFFVFSQTVLIDAAVEHDRLSVEYFGQTSTQDSGDVTVSEMDGSYIISASYFSPELERLFDPILVTRAEDGSVLMRLEAAYADREDGHWVFYDGRSYEAGETGLTAESFECRQVPEVTMESSLFSARSRDITTMDGRDARAYLERLRSIDLDSWYRSRTEYLSRLFSPLPILVLVLISLLMNYRFKKNVFLFSLIQSLCTAVVYYVVQMLVSIMCEQAMMPPSFSVIIPVVTVLALSLLIRLIGAING